MIPNCQIYYLNEYFHNMPKYFTTNLLVKSKQIHNLLKITQHVLRLFSKEFMIFKMKNSIMLYYQTPHFVKLGLRSPI